METGGARLLVAADGVGQQSDIKPESEEVAAALDSVAPLDSVALLSVVFVALPSEDSDPLLSIAQDSQDIWASEEVAAAVIWPESEEVTMENVSNPLLAVDSDPLLVVDSDPLLSVALFAADYMTPDSQEVTADSVALDSQEPDEGKTPESMEVVPDSLPPGAFVCGRCGLVHEDREAWNRAHSRFYPCPSCGLIHADIKFDAMFGRIKVDCERFMEHYPGWLPTKDTKASQE